MNWMILAVTVTLILLVFRIVYDFVPLYPFNDLSKKSKTRRKRDLLFHYVPIGAMVLFNALNHPVAHLAALLLAVIYTLGIVAVYWLPYFKGTTEERSDKFERLYGKTHRFLPKRGSHPIPNTAQTLASLLVILVLAATLGNMVWGTGLEPAQKVTSDIPSQEEEQPLKRIETAFTQAGEQPDLMLIDAIKSAKSSMDIAINAINKDEIVTAIVQAVQRGVNVRVITDRNEAAGAAQSIQLSRLLSAHIPVKENAGPGLMNLKMAIIDESTVITGSYNYTVNASTINEEVLVIIRDEETAGKWKQYFETMWNDTERYRELTLSAISQ